MKADKPVEINPQEKTNYDLLYRLYDFILSPEWDALAEEEEQFEEETAEIPVLPAQAV